LTASNLRTRESTMNVNEIIRLPDPRVNVRAEIHEVVRDVNGRPHVFVRIKLTGWHFTHRAQEPFMVVGNVVSQRVIISRDGLSAQGYFNQLPPPAKTLAFGYGNIIQWDFNLAIDPGTIVRLDRLRLPPGVFDPF
jgi:hypothetical protein